ncbi:ornithine cyclodeaminase family protein [Georgenia alba]|uniref:Ornithine cyclodeaminase family protein n=1 Tax=Georgenia alba TaxID=2233858 RepID=A0ABW2Q9U9_9MICO
MSLTFAGMRLISAEEVAATTSYTDAVDALEAALRSGLDPEHDTPRSRVETDAGELLVMPATLPGHSGVKTLSLTPGNAGSDVPVIQGGFLLMEGPAQRPAAYIDGIALTNLRTPAVSALAVRHLAPEPAGPERVTVFGTGPQARGHARALLETREVAEVLVVGRPEAASAVVAGLAEQLDGAAARAVDRADAEAVAQAVATSDVICCCTSSAEPVLDGELVRDGAVVVAMGSHDPDRREVGDALVRRASAVVVEARTAALREAGDVVIPLSSGVLAPDLLVTLQELVTGVRTVDRGPRFFKSTGMSWEDLVVATAVYDAHGDPTRGER